MNEQNPNISQNQPQDHAPVIRQLDDAAINRIAAGEVVERPASAVKELVENAIDAGASRVEIDYADGGKTLIRVTDDGCGMAPDELPLALSRHATSKLPTDDLLDIHSFGFRGEALPSLGAVGRLTITSRRAGQDGATITVAGGDTGPVRPAALNQGTIVELRDLFYATPARLKFMRTDRAEAKAIGDVVKRVAMGAPTVGFELRDVSNGNSRTLFKAPAETGTPGEALKARLSVVLGKEFAQNALEIDAEREEIGLSGFAALPTYSRGSGVAQYIFVNGRPVKDKILLGALRAAYSDFLSRDRHPAACLFIDCAPQRVDVNVHPAKSEVRFREPGVVRGLIVSGLRHALAEAGHRASSTVTGAALGAMTPESHPPASYQMPLRPHGSGRAAADTFARSHAWQAPEPAPLSGFAEPSARFEEAEMNVDALDLPLGAARAQLHENYIVAQTKDGMIVVDQHAAHERLVYERLKNQLAENGVATQALLIPEIIELSEQDVSLLLTRADDLARLGLIVESFGGSAIAVRETPALLGEVDAKKLVLDVLDELADLGESQFVQERIEAVLSSVACHGSIRSGRRMRVEEMNELLRQMEATPHSGQCNHGRPTYVELKLADIEKLFGRS